MSGVASFFLGIWISITSIFVPAATSEVVVKSQPSPAPAKSAPAPARPVESRTPQAATSPSPAPQPAKHAEITLQLFQGFGLGRASFTPRSGLSCDAYTAVKVRDGVELAKNAIELKIAANDSQCDFQYLSPCKKGADTWVNLKEGSVIVGAIVLPEFCEEG